jgi:hypothetical protein
MLGVIRVRSKHADIRKLTFLYAEAKLFFSMFKVCQHTRAYRVYVTHNYAYHTLDISLISRR